jgi:Ribbon-helix-helix protein, copG family
MTEKRIYGRTKSGEPITDEMVERFAKEAERGYTPLQLKGRRRGPGRPPLGDAAKAVESVRLEPDLRNEVARRAEVEGVTVSEVIRRALREYLKSA